jgi:glycosyltransferase involved in cell wall biosynthesis
MKLSVLMPAYNGAATLAEAIKAVLAVVYPCEMEVVCRHVHLIGKVLRCA